MPDAPGPNSTAAPSRILVRGVNWLGDAVMTTPALRRLRERFPDARITLLTHEKLADLWLHQPDIDEVSPFSAADGPWSVSRRLIAGKFDLALILPNSPRSALESWLGRIPRRVGYARGWRRWLLTEAVDERPGYRRMHKRTPREIARLVRNPAAASCAPAAGQPSDFPAHHLHDYLHLAAALGASAELAPPRLTVSPEEMAAAALKFKLPREGAGEGPLLGLNPGAEYGPAKRWPLERFVATAREIQSRTRCTWLLLGGRADGPLTQSIEAALQAGKPASGSGVVNLAGRTSLRELMAVLKQCRLLLTNDTGPMHLAAALDTPVVAPFGSTSPDWTAPGMPGDSRHALLRSSVPCAPCFLRTCPIDFRCMTEISTERVTAAVMERCSATGST